MEIVTAIIGPVVNSLMVPIKKHLGFLVYSSKHVKDMDDRVMILEGIATDVEEKKEANEVNRWKVPTNVPEWLKQVEKIKVEATGIAATAGNGCFNMKMRYKAGKRSSDILKEIERLISQESEIKWNNEEIPLGRISSNKPSTSAAQVLHDGAAQVLHDGAKTIFESRELIFQKALKSLEPSDKTQMIALCGMGGVGKTTMMEQLKNTVKDMKMFDWVMKADIGQNANPIAAQQAIADYMGGGPLTETDKGARADRLHERFEERIKSGKNKILVILDDVWKEFDLKDIGLPNPLPNGVKLFLTSRNEKVCSLMGVANNSIIRVVVLEDSEAKFLFWENAGHSNAADPELHKIGDDIAKRCGGLPIAVKTIASNLKDNDKDEWKDALYSLEHNDFENLYDLANKVFEISYNNLQKNENKAIFLLSGLFPDDFYIPIEDLMRYGWGLNIFNKVYTLERARHRTNTCVYELIRANLLIKSDRIGCIKMHDLVRGFVVSNVSKFKQASIVNHDESPRLTQDTMESCERVLMKCTGMTVFPVDFNFPNLLLLKLMDGGKLHKFPEEFYNRMKKLEVVSYESMHISLLPQYSTKLRTLCLHSCLLMDDFSYIGDLINLEILSFAKCRIRKLPFTIRKLIKLKLLDLSRCGIRFIDDGVFQNLVKLEELYMGVCNMETISLTDSNCHELKILLTKLFALEFEFFKNNALPENASFTNLKRFKISMGCLLEEDDEYSFKNKLKLVTNRIELLTCKVNELFEKTEELYLQVSDMNHLRDVSVHSSQHSFSSLRVLTFFGCEDLRYLFSIPVANSLTKLERLSVSSCPVLKSLVHNESGNSETGLVKIEELSFLSLEKLPKLESLCDSDNVVELPQLVELRLGGLPNITSIYPDNHNSTMQPFLNQKVRIPKLEKLKISVMKNLKQIWPCVITSSQEVNISVLREIKVSYCDSLVNLFPTNPFLSINQLEKIKVKKCDSVEVLFNIDVGCVGKMDQIGSSLRIIHVKDLRKLREICTIKGANNSSLLIRGFQDVKSIWIDECKSFRTLFTPTTMNFGMRELVDIRIRGGTHNSSNSRELIFEEALKALQPNNNKTQMIALCGMGSVGKTTMMEKLKKVAGDLKMFDYIVKVVIGVVDDPISLQHAIAEKTGGALTETTKEERASVLEKRFMGMSQDGQKKILVILDDIWARVNLKDIGLPSPLTNGIKLLLTSRVEEACRAMGILSDSIFRVNVLNVEEANALFFGIVGLSDGDDPELHKIGEDIVKCCLGLPFAIKTIASSLIDNVKDEWKSALSRLQHPGYDLVDVFEASYNNLKNSDDKAIFLLSGLYPDDFDIPVKDLMRYGWGLNLFNKVYSLSEARQRTNSCVYNLIRANLLTESDRIGCVNMHYRVRDFALRIQTEVKQISVLRIQTEVEQISFLNGRYISEWPTEDKSESYERILLKCTGKSELPRDFNYPNLAFFKLMDGDKLLKYPKDFYERMEKLKVMAYENMHVPVLPQYSTKLRTLCLRSCSLMDDLSSLGDLINLEILSFAKCHIRKLPSTIGKLIKLKLLDVTGCSDLRIDDGVFRNLVSLEELYMRVSSSEVIRFTDANCDELERLSVGLFALEVEFFENKAQPKNVSFKKLESFKISIGCLLGYKDTDSLLNTLKLVTNRCELLECKVNELFEKTEKLDLQVKDMNNLEDVIMHPSQHSFSKLRVLDISECADLTCLFTIPVASGLTRLERLTVSSCPVLKSLVHGESETSGAGEIKFQELKFLSLNRLPKMLSLCDTDDVVELQQLLELRLGGLPNFTCIYPCNNNMSAMQQPFMNKKVTIPKLERLMIYSMQNLKQIWPSHVTTEQDNVSTLREIAVEGCDSLVNLFPINPLPLLNRLEELKVKECGSIEVLFNIDLGCVREIEQVSINLRSIQVSELEKLTEIWRIKGAANNSDIIIRGFQAIKSITIERCKRFRDVITPATPVNFDM